MNILQQFIKVLGGPGSGNFGHAGRPGQVGGSAPDGEVQQEGGSLGKRMPGMKPAHRKALIKILQKLPAYHVASIKQFTTEPDVNIPVTVLPNGLWSRSQEGVPERSEIVHAVFNNESRTLSISPYFLDGVIGESRLTTELVAHEVGHSVFDELLNKDDELWGKVQPFMLAVKKQARAFTGVNRVSFGWGEEFMADVYRIWQLGTPEQKGLLDKLATKRGINLTELMAPPTLKVHGGVGSGNFGHAGRPGQVGGSAPASMRGFEPRGAISRGSFEKGAEPVWTRGGKPISGDDLKRVEVLKGTKVWGPGYIEAWVNGDPKAELLAVAKDGKGRYHRIYSREHIEKALLEKHDRVRAMTGDTKTMDRRAAADRREGVPEAYLYKLENLTTFRMGSNRDTKAKVQAYGLTTLEGRHITVDGDSLRFQFTAKGGKEVDRTLRDAELAGFVRARKEERGDGRLWPEITASRFNAYLDRLAPAGRNYKAKDFRDYHATRLALKVMRKHASSGGSSERAWKRACNEAARQASEFLGNTPAMARQVYIDPLVFDVGRPMMPPGST